MIGLIGRKIGMTRLFSKEGISTPITVIEVKKNYVTQIKSVHSDKYVAIQVTTGRIKKNKLNKSKSGHFLKAKVRAGRGLWEFRVVSSNNFCIGQEINLQIFKDVKKLDITGKTKGKGFSGTVKRWNFRTQDASHGNSLSHRAPGSIGQNQTPGRVFPGKKMAGHLGNSQVTIQNLKIMRIDFDKDLLLIKGSIPGSTGGNLILRPAIKSNKGK